MTLFGENGFVLGRQAFSSARELVKTVLHELYRLSTSAAASGVSGASAAAETAAADSLIRLTKSDVYFGSGERMETTKHKWIEAGTILADDPDAKVMCPTCGREFLRVEDQAHGAGSDLVDRYMHCDACGAHEIIVRLRKAR